MPRAFLRLLAVALLALTVPVQGMAAVMAGQCMAFGHHQDAGQDHGHVQGDEPGAHEHDETAVHDDESGSNLHCGPCTACCASPSIAGPAGVSIISSPSNTKYLLSQAPPPGVEPHRLDRPPLAL